MIKKLTKKACVVFAAISVLFSQSIYAAPTDSLQGLMDSLNAATPYSSDYVQATLALADFAANNKLAKPQEQAAKAQLEKAMPRVQFLEQNLIKNLGQPLGINVYNYQYVDLTVAEVESVFTLISGEYEFKNKSTADAISNKIRRIRDIGEERLLLIENSIKALSQTSDKQTVEKAFTAYSALKKDVDLISYENVQKLILLVEKHEINTESFPLRIIPQKEKDLGSLTEQSMLRLRRMTLDNSDQRQNESNIFTAYEPIDRIRITAGGMGGKISATEFTYTLPSEMAVCIALDEYGNTYDDLDTDPKTITFLTDQLCDYTFVVPKDIYPYSSAYTSRMEWQYQNYTLGKLAQTIEPYMHNTIKKISTAGIAELPYSILVSYAAANRAIEFVNEGVVLYPSAMQSIDDKTADVPLEYLYTLAKNTEKEGKAQFSEQAKPETQPTVAPVENKTPPAIKPLAIAGGLIAVIAVIYVYRREKASE